MKRKVLMEDVLRWVRQAIRAAERDPGDSDGTTTALSYRELGVDIKVQTGGVSVIFVGTRNSGFSGNGWRTHRAITDDGAIILWEEELGVPTGADWLPEEFFAFMRGGES